VIVALLPPPLPLPQILPAPVTVADSAPFSVAALFLLVSRAKKAPPPEGGGWIEKKLCTYF